MMQSFDHDALAAFARAALKSGSRFSKKALIAS
jgi:hypothetical protein